MIKLCAFADEASPNIEGQIAALKRNGMDFLEVRGVNGTNIGGISNSEAKKLKKQLDDAGLAVWSIGSPIGKYPLSDDFAPHLDAYKRILELADILNANHIRMFSFHPSAGEQLEITRQKAFERLDKLCEATPSNIILCHENEKYIFGETPECCREIHQAFPTIRAVFDPANFVQCGVDTLTAWDMLKEYVEYIHIKDASTDGTVVPAGMGAGNVAEIIKRYLAQGGSVMTLEPHLQDFVGLSGLENGESVKNEATSYKNHDESFDTAARALKAILSKC